MGITGAHELSHSVMGLSLQDVFNICSYARQQQKSDIQPTIDLDASLLYRSSKLSVDNRMLQLVDISCQLACLGFLVVIICDGAERHHTKRASVQRQADLFNNKIKSYLMKVQLMSIAARKSAAVDENEKESIKIEEKRVCNDIRSLEKRLEHADVDVGQEFFVTLEKHIQNIPKANLGKKNGKISIIQAQYQADSVLAYRRVNNISDIVFSSDSDLLAHAGPMCLGIKIFIFQYTLRGKKAGIDNIELFTADVGMLETIAAALHKGQDDKNIKKSKNPIFDGIVSPSTRALLAIGLGCDVYKSGIRGVTKTVLKEWLDVHKEDYQTPRDLHNKLLNFYVDRFYCDNTRTKKMTHSNIITNEQRNDLIKFINILLESFMHEPCNYVSTSAEQVLTNDCAIYIHNNKPSTLHIYCKEFAKNDNTIKIVGDTNDVSTCVGIGKSQHSFLTFEGVHTCFRCNIICCKYCNFDLKKEGNLIGNKYCYKCYLMEKCVPEVEIEEHVPYDQMVQTLNKVGIDVLRDENFDVVMALYDRNICKNDLIFGEEVLNSCEMPFENSDYFKSEETLFGFSFAEGGMILRNTYLDYEDKMNLINLITKLVIVKVDPINKTHAAIPQFLVKCAKACRIRSGDRLLQRALRHAVDNERNDISKADGAVIKYNNTLGLKIKSKVRASMKNTHYDVTVSFCENGIIANKCSCKVGCYGVQRIVCIHILPVLQQFSMAIYAHYADDFLYHLNQEWDPDFMNSVTAEGLVKLQENTLALIQASCPNGHSEYTNKQTISELLKQFDAGTDKTRKGPGPPLNKSQLGPLRNTVFESPTVAAIKERNNKNVVPKTWRYNDLPEKEIIPYNEILNMIKFIREVLPTPDDENVFSDCVGYKVLGLRAQESGGLFDVLSLDKKQALLNLLEKGNQSHRCTRRRQKIGKENIVDELEVSEEINEMNNISASEKDTPTITHNTTQKFYRKCCVPFCTSVESSSFYRRLPQCKKKNVMTCSDQVRRTYAIKHLKRKQWIVRFGLTESACSPHVLYCCHHDIENTEIEMSWKNSAGEIITEIVEMHLPRDNNALDIVTRSDHKKRQLVEQQPPAVKKKRISIADPGNKNKQPHRVCYYVNCCVNSFTPNAFFTRVPPLPKNIPTETSNNSVRYNHARTLLFRAEYLRRIGASTNDVRTSLRICNNHQLERVTKQMTYELRNGTMSSEAITFNVPTPFTEKSNLNVNSATKNRRNKGSSYNRFETNCIKQSAECAEKGDGWAYVLLQAMEHNEGNRTTTDNRALLGGDLPASPTTRKRKPLYGIIQKEKKVKENVSTGKRTVIQISTITQKVLMATTGFRSIASMISFIIIICNGDTDLMGTTSSSLTWLEQWYFYFERVYGRSLLRMVDCSIKYRLNENILRKIFINILSLIIATRKRWPMYVTMSEDAKLRAEKWNSTYDKRRIVMWDNTSVPLPTPSHPNLQRNTYSDYYGGNVGKGSVFVQLCGWLGTHELWEGAVTDTEYFRRSGILQLQQQYVEKYDPEFPEIKWCSILDRGYKVVADCFAAAGQTCLQPAFSRTGVPKFTASDTQLTAAVAADRGANERAVRMSKLSRYVSEGYKQTVSLDQLCDVWLAWSFQVNFVYKPVV